MQNTPEDIIVDYEKLGAKPKNVNKNRWPATDVRLKIINNQDDTSVYNNERNTEEKNPPRLSPSKRNYSQNSRTFRKSKSHSQDIENTSTHQNIPIYGVATRGTQESQTKLSQCTALPSNHTNKFKKTTKSLDKPNPKCTRNSKVN